MFQRHSLCSSSCSRVERQTCHRQASDEMSSTVPDDAVYFVDDDALLGEDGAFDPEHDARVVRELAYSFGDASVYEAARRGDLKSLRRLIELDNVDPNDLDSFNASPLYYASLCGHLECVRYLLQRGARCEVDSHDGERCHYAALNDSCRALLRQYEAANRLRGPLFSFTHRHFNNPHLSDVEFRLWDGTVVFAHRVLLAARSPYFRDRFASGGKWWGMRAITLPDRRLEGNSLLAVLSYMYTERLLCAPEVLPGVAVVARNLRLHHLAAYAAQLATSHNPTAAVSEVAGSLVVVDLGRPYVVGSVGGLDDELLVESTTDLNVLADEALLYHVRARGLRRAVWKGLLRSSVHPVIPRGLWDEESLNRCADGAEDTDDQLGPSPLSDVTIVCGGVNFHAHLFVLLGRARHYFEAAVRFYRQSRPEPASPEATITLELQEVSPSVFARILEYLYCDVLLELSLEEVMEALQLVEEFSISDGIRPLLVAQAIRHISKDTVVDLLTLGELLHLQRLTRACARFVARNLDAIVVMSSFRALVAGSAASITGRQQTDSVPVLDDIRSAILELYGQTQSEVIHEAFCSGREEGDPHNARSSSQRRQHERETKLRLISELAVSLQLQAATSLKHGRLADGM